MKIIEFNKIGGPEVLTLVEHGKPKPKKNEVLVNIKACGLNQAELLFFQGQYLFQPQFPSRIGLEASGIVEEVGDEVPGFNEGDEVCLTPNIMPYEYGYIGEYAVVPQEAVVKKPSGISFEEAASFWMTYGTAYLGLILRGNIKPNDNKTVLITAASSGVGIAAMQMAKHLGCRVIATTRNEGKEEFLKTQGADFIINTKTGNIVEEINHITKGAGYDVAFDPIAGNMMTDLAEAAANEAKIILYGALSYELDAPLPLFPTLAKGLKFSGAHLVFHLLQHKERFEAAKKHLLEGLSSGIYRPVIDRKFALKDVSEAYTYMQSNQQMGKIVITT